MSFINMAVLVPSYGRPENVARLAEALNATCTAGTELFVVVEKSDPKLDEYLEDRDDYYVFVRDEPEKPGMVAALNWGYRALEKAQLTGTIDCLYSAVAFMGDDHLPRTMGWDREYLDALEDGAAIVYGNDLLQGEVMPTQVCMDATIPIALGYMAPPEFFHLCIDLAWKDWGEGLGRLTYLPEVIVEHLHPANEKAPWDANYERVNNPQVITEDARRYEVWKAQQLPRELAVLSRVYGD